MVHYDLLHIQDKRHCVQPVNTSIPGWFWDSVLPSYLSFPTSFKSLFLDVQKFSTALSSLHTWRQLISSPNAITLTGHISQSSPMWKQVFDCVVCLAWIPELNSKCHVLGEAVRLFRGTGCTTLPFSQACMSCWVVRVLGMSFVPWMKWLILISVCVSPHQVTCFLQTGMAQGW